MVKTLFKYEFKAYAKTLLPMNGILVVIALLNRIIQFMENDHFSYDIIFGFSIFALVVSMVFLLVFTTIFIITRYYKNMFSSEGYLTMTLPVTPSQHIFVKLVSAFAFGFVSFVGVFVSGCIVTSGRLLSEIFKSIGYLLKLYFENLGVHGALYIVEGAVLFVTTVLCAILLLYLCMTVGQLAKKNRVLASFGVYFGIYIASQILSSIATVLFFMAIDHGLLEWVIRFVDKSPIAFAHTFIIGVTLVTLAVFSLFWYITHNILKNRLNLE